MEEKKAKQEEMDNAKTSSSSSGGGDLLSDLANKLAMRRKGISGNDIFPKNSLKIFLITKFLNFD